MPEIGDQLRETRMRNRIDITEVEAATKIRAKYLRALENEEWDLLPGPTFVKTFLRTYADYLGLDARNLVEEYRSRYERASGPELTPFGPNRGSRRARPPRRFSLTPWLLIGLGLILLVGALFVIGSWGDDNDPARRDLRHADAEGIRRGGRRRAEEEKGEAAEEGAGGADGRAAADPAHRSGQRVRRGRLGRPGDQQRHARRQPGHGDVPLQALHDVVRDRRRGDARRRQGVPGVRRRARGLLGQGRRQAAPACRSARPADERPRGHRRHRHGGPVGDHPRPQRPLALGAAARARRRAGTHRRGRRPPGRRPRRARVPGRRGRRPDPHHRRARADRRRPHRRGRGRVRGAARWCSTPRWRSGSSRSCGATAPAGAPTARRRCGPATASRR